MNPCAKHEQQTVRENGSGFDCYLCRLERVTGIKNDLQQACEEKQEALNCESELRSEFYNKTIELQSELHTAQHLKDKLITDTGKGCSVCGSTPVVHIPDEGSNAYWLCGGCVAIDLDEKREALSRLGRVVKALEGPWLYDPDDLNGMLDVCEKAVGIALEAAKDSPVEGEPPAED